MVMKLFYDFEFKHPNHYQTVFMDIAYKEDIGYFDIFMLIPRKFGDREGKILRTSIQLDNAQNEHEQIIRKNVCSIYSESLSENGRIITSKSLDFGLNWYKLLNAEDGYLFQNFYIKFLEYMKGLEFFESNISHYSLKQFHIGTSTNLYNFLNYDELELADSKAIPAAILPKWMNE